MNTIYFKFMGGQPNDFSNTPVGYFAVGANRPISEDGAILLSPECRHMAELRSQANRLKKLIDDAMIEAERYLPD